MTTTLADRHALVTGGGTGIGAAIATSLARAGAAVTICGRRLESLKALAARQANINPIVADVTDEAAMVRLHAQAESQQKPFDIVVANAGMAESAPAHKTSLDLWNRTLGVNLTGPFLTVRPALGGMRQRGFGRIIFVASTAGLKGYPYVAPYVAAKHGVIGLMRALAAELSTTGVTVNAVCPGFTETEVLSDSVRRIVEITGRSEEDARASLATANPLGRFIQPEEVAQAVLWLCGDGAAAITSQSISVSGGETW